MRIREWALALVLAFAAIVVSLTCYAQSATGTSPLGRDYRVVHIFVALCDNRNQGIVPVPEALGNGQDPASNLYWGAQFGADTFFRHSPDWKPLTLAVDPAAPVLARSAFVSTGPGIRTFLIFEAYDGAHMKSALTDFLLAAAGSTSGTVEAADGTHQYRFPAWSGADLVCFAGHNGLMDVRLDTLPERKAGAAGPEGAVVLACKSSPFFREPLRRAGCAPILTTLQLMAPEAYTLDAAIRSWAAGDPPAAVRDHAAAAYAKYQKIPLSAARRVFLAGAAN